MADEEEILRRDQELHPDCTYSTTSSQRCSSVNGSFVCEVLKQIQRNCPGKRPESVYYSKTVDNGASVSQVPAPMDIDKHFSGFGGGFINPFGLLGEIFGQLGGNDAPSGFSGRIDVPGFPGIEFGNPNIPKYEDRANPFDLPLLPPHKSGKASTGVGERVGPVEKI